MEALVTIAELQQFKHVADSVKNAVSWPQFCVEAQQLDVKYWLGDGLLNEICTQNETSPTSLSAANIALLDGGSYTYQNNTYLFQGLKACIIYFAFARFTSKTPYNYTAAGITVKDTDFSTQASDKAIQRLSTEAFLTASSIKDEIVLFLRRNSTTYPLFKCGLSRRARTFTVIGD